jgi:4a-hydroxytetrahydrobiopterin dehydratase
MTRQGSEAMSEACEADSTDLAERKCTPCRGGVPPLDPAAVERFLARLDGWAVVDGHHLSKEYRFPDFAQALEFAVRVGAVAEENGHHPDMYIAWGKVRIDIWSHKVDGLTESDFVLAAKCDQILAPT